MTKKEIEIKDLNLDVRPIEEFKKEEHNRLQKTKDFNEKAAKLFSREGQAEAFYKQQPIYYDKSGIWWLWNKEEYKWVMCDDIDILNFVKSVMDLDTISSKSRAEIINALKQEGRKHEPEIPEKHWVQFKDTIVNVKTGERIKASPEYFMTNPIPHKIGESEDTPTLDKYFRDWVVEEGLQDESYIDTLYEIISYSMLQDQFLQRLFACVGSGSNGKGVYLSIIQKFLGDENCCTSELKILATKQFEASALYKKQSCFMGEVDAYDMENTNLLKKLTGEDDIRYEFKRKTPFSEKSSTTCFMNTNALPVTPDKSKGFYRRWLIVDFPHEFPVGKDILGEIPDQEFENLAAKCIRIAGELYENKKFTNEGDLSERIKRYEDRSNPLMGYVVDYCEEDPEHYTVFQDFCKEFNEYLKKNRLRVMTKRRISKGLKDEGFQVKDKKKAITKNGDEVHTTCIFGLKILPDHPNPLKPIEIPSYAPIEVNLKNGWSLVGFSGLNHSNPPKLNVNIVKEDEEDE